MTCTQLITQLDEFFDGAMDETVATTLSAHILGCDDCRRVFDSEQVLKETLEGYREFDVPQPDADFYDRAMAKAARSNTLRQRNRWVMTGVGGTIAAGLVIWMLAGLLFQAPEMPQSSIPTVAMTLEEPRTFNLVFSSATALANATMTVTLPPGVEIEGFAGQREITWMTSLVAGKNVLPLTLIATSAQGGELMATLQHEDDDRTFRVQVSVI